MNLYNALYHNLPCICITTDRSGVIVDLNQMGRQRLGYAPQDLIGKEVISLFGTVDHDSLQACLSDGLVGVDQQTISTVCLIARNGESIWVKLTLRILPSEASGDLIVFFCEDRCEFRQLEVTLHKKTKKFN